jgi:mRNA-degrading endonuclease YafQ of YafQ-DinJ toxin-antitoxin module
MPATRKLVFTKAFDKAFQKFAGKNQTLQAAIEKALLKLKQDAFDPSLKTHRLSGKLAVLLACSCGYDCRILFTIEKDVSNEQLENIVLLDIGTHDDVY